MSCSCNGEESVTSWYDLQHAMPQNPLDLIANAALGGVQGVFANSTQFINPPGGIWVSSPISVNSATVLALGTDSQQQVEDAIQWVFQHGMINVGANI